MKKLILVALAAVATVAGAQTSNLLNYVNTGTGANTGTGDPLRTAFGKINGDFVLLSGIVDSNSAAGVTNLVLTTTNLPAGSAAFVTNTGVAGNLAYILVGIPAGAPGTNTVTAYNFTNQLLGSQKVVWFTTNYTTFGTSNYLARVTNLYDWSAYFGQLGGSGMSPGTNVFGELRASFSGTNGWFVLTNGFYTPSNLTVVAVGAGGGNGQVTLSGTDHPELWGKANSLYGQTISLPTPPKSRDDIANKGYVDDAIATAIATAFAFSTDANNVSHYSYAFLGSKVLDLIGQLQYINILACNLDATGTNVAVQIATTNLVAGWELQSSTNLVLANGGFTTWTNYVPTTNTGILNLTIAATLPMQFFRAVKINGTAVAIGSTISVTHSTNSTFGLGAGLMAYSQISGTNYLVFSTGTNTWGRVAIPTNGW